jgi:hypothetical protein
MRSRSLLPALALGAALAPAAMAQSFTRVIGTGDAVPGGAHPILTFDEAPCLVGDHIAFLASHQNLGGFVSSVYSNASGSFAPVVATGETMPTEGVPFEFLIRLTADADAIAVQGSSFVGGIARNGIYSDAPGALTELVDQNTSIPGAFGSFTQIGGQDFAFDAGQVVFTGSGPSSLRGIYTADAVNGGLARVVDSTMPMPGQPAGTDFSFFGEPVIHGDRVVFAGNGGGTSGIFEQYAPGVGSIDLVVDTSTPVPGGGAWWLVVAPVISEDATLFQGYGPSIGLYRAEGGAVATVADGSMSIPGGTGTFPEFNARAMTQGRAVFEAFDFNFGGQIGIYSDWCGSLQPVVVPGDVIDGLTVSHVNIDQDSVDGGRMAATLTFTDFSQAIYLIDLDSMTSYGSGHAGAVGSVPTLAGVGCPDLDTDVELRLRDGPLGGAGFLVVGLAPESAPFPTGGTLLARPDVVVPIALNGATPGKLGGWLDLMEHIPADPALSGETFRAQGAWPDPAVPGGWILTAGLAVPVP